MQTFLERGKPMKHPSFLINDDSLIDHYKSGSIYYFYQFKYHNQKHNKVFYLNLYVPFHFSSKVEWYYGGETDTLDDWIGFETHSISELPIPFRKLILKTSLHIRKRDRVRKLFHK
jgi:hypothetical protein